MSAADQKALDRRRFLGAAGGGVSTVAVALSPIAASEAQAYDPGTEESKARYRETPHVKAFYRTVGYETLKK